LATRVDALLQFCLQICRTRDLAFNIQVWVGLMKKPLVNNALMGVDTGWGVWNGVSGQQIGLQNQYFKFTKTFFSTLQILNY
jgi:hypothetical protein